MEEKKDVRSQIEGDRKKHELRKAYRESGVTREEWKVACEYLNVGSEELAVICEGQAYRLKDKSVAEAMTYLVRAFNELSKNHISKEEIQNVCNIHNYLFPDKSNVDIYIFIIYCENISQKEQKKFIDEVRLKLKDFRNEAKKRFKDTGLQKRQIQNIISTVPPLPMG